MTDLYAVFYINEDQDETLDSIYTDYYSALESTSELAEEYGDVAKFQIVKFQPGQHPSDGDVLNVFGDPVRVGA